MSNIQLKDNDSAVLASTSHRRRCKLTDILMGRLIVGVGAASILILLMICGFLIRESIPVLRHTGIWAFITGCEWQPEFEKFGLVPLLAGSAVTTIGAVLIAVPIGVACAIYTAEIAPVWLRELLKPTIEIVAGIPSVVIGFIGLVVVAPFMQHILNLPTGLTAITGSVMLAFMSIPTIASISEDSIMAVPKVHRDASMALGANKWETIWRVVVPSAKSGITAACMLGVGRAIGETMTVLMVTGNAANVPNGLAGIVPFFLGPVKTMTATIAADMGETVQYSFHYHALFATGLALFAVSFAINCIADIALGKVRH